MVTLDNLPNEIQQMVFNNLRNETADITECILVCKKWKRLYQKQLYSSICLYGSTQLAIFLNTLENNQCLRGLVKQLKFQYKHDYRNQKKNANVAKLFSLLHNLEHIDCSVGRYYLLLSDTLLANQLPKLNYMEAPMKNKEIRDYATCAFILKDRLKNLAISELDEGDDEYSTGGFLEELFFEDPEDDEDEDDIQQNVQFCRIFDRLGQFKNVVDLHILKRCDNIVDLLEKLTRDCPSVQRLHLEFFPHNENNESNSAENTNVTEPHYSPAFDVNHLKFGGSVLDDSKAVRYIIHKFPRLRVLDMLGRERQTSYLDDFTFTMFLNYLEKIKCVTVLNIPCNQQATLKSIDSFWKALSQSHMLSVGFDYSNSPSNPVDVLDVEIREGHSKNGFFYHSPGAGLQHTNIIKNYGQYIDSLSLSGITSIVNHLSQELEHALFETLVLQPLKFCGKLKHLSIMRCSLSGLNISGCHRHLRKDQIDSLRLMNCAIDDNIVFERLSTLFASVKHLELSQIRYTSNLSDETTPLMNIDMTETDIGTLSLSRSQLYNSNSNVERAILVKILVNQNYRNYMYECSQTDCIFKPVSKEVYDIERNCGGCFMIGISSKSLKNLIVSHQGRKVRLGVV